MRAPEPVTLEGHGVRLEPLARAHHDALVDAASDGELWNLWFTSVPAPVEAHAYISAALAGQDAGHMLPWAVRELSRGAIVGSTRYHDIVPAIDRVEIGYTWYAARCQRTNLNTTCKLLLLEHAFDALYARSDSIRLVTTRSEQGAAYMAYGYARSTGRVGVYSVVPGPGVFNTGAALTTAYAGNAPVLCLTGQWPTPTFVPGMSFEVGRGELGPA